MILRKIVFGVAAFLVLVQMCFTQRFDLPAKREGRPSRYPLQVHQMYRDHVLKKPPKTVGEWSAWSHWSPCSRSCGGGVTQQTRNCINRPEDSRFVRKQRRRRQNSKSANGCVGLYKRIHLCNSQECPDGRDFRYEQCAGFNHRFFKGRRFDWEPFLKVKDECALNCRAVGMNFFATLNKTVIDGTPCLHPVTSTGKSAPKGTRGICIEGYCKSVNSRGVIGSIDETQEECSSCLKGSCRSINGIYTRPDLPPGYSLVAQIPAGACRILIQQLKHTRNILALKNSNGSFIVNGDWKFSNSRVFHGAGTKFIYVRQDENSLETLTSPGPLANSIDIMIVNYQMNPGIKYGYSLPVDHHPVLAPPLIKKPTIIEPAVVETRRLESPLYNISQRDEPRPPSNHIGPRRARRRRYPYWKITGITACSKSCGGGIQTYVRTCYREVSPSNQVPVSNRRCAHIKAPAPAPVPCNVEPCPTSSPSWDGYWTECSVTCGDGVQQYLLQCQQGSIIVGDEHCPKPKPSSQTRPCRKVACEINDNELPQTIERLAREWTVGSWSECSVSCGTGHKTRSVTCPSGLCQVENRPATAEHCNGEPCLTADSQSSSTNSFSYWLVSEWSPCSENCGTGTQNRLAVCGIETRNQDTCNSEGKPELSRACSSEKLCGGQWFTGPWGPCSDSCTGRAKQKRQVFCVVKIRGQSHITNEMTCSSKSKPQEEQACDGVCPPYWFMGDWGQCEGSCPSGVQRREVRCLDIYGRPAEGCSEEEMPTAKRICACEGVVDQTERYKPAQDEPINRSCVDRIRKCKLAVQARLCHYPYYVSHCCESCRRAQQDLLE